MINMREIILIKSSKCKTTLDNKVFHSNILSNYIIEFILNLNKKNWHPFNDFLDYFF